MNPTRFNALLSQQTSTARKVWSAVPHNVRWQPPKIYGEFKRMNPSSTISLSVVQGCLKALVDAGLVKESPKNFFIQVAPSTSVSDVTDQAVVNEPATETDITEAHVEPATPQPDVEDYAVIDPNLPGRTDSSILKAATVGDKIRYLRAKDVEYKAWKQRVWNLRIHYKKSGIEFESEFFDDYCLLTITKSPNEKPSPPSESSDTESVGHTALQGVVSPTAAKVASKEEKDFWMRTFVLYCGVDIDAAESAKRADEALRLYRERFDP